MATDFYIATGLKEIKNKNLPVLLSLNSDAYYWFLYKYFESANLARGHELINLYGDMALDGYQLERLEEEWKIALVDVSARPNIWNVLVGWNSEKATRDTEDRRPVEKHKMVELINQLLALIRQARESRLKLVYVGD